MVIASQGGDARAVERSGTSTPGVYRPESLTELAARTPRKNLLGRQCVRKTRAVGRKLI